MDEVHTPSLAHDQKILEIVHSKLREIAEGLRSGRFTHVSWENIGDRIVPCDVDGFQMRVWFESAGPSCGSAGCIGGWLEQLLGSDRSSPFSVSCAMTIVRHRWAFRRLFYGYVGDPTPAQAADAIDRALADQDPWPPGIDS